MHAQFHILETLVKFWDHELGLFDLQGETLDLTVEDIYFTKITSRRGAPVNLEGTSRGGDALSVQDYINVYCFPRNHKSGTQIPIAQITIFTLKLLLRTMFIVARSYTLHLAA